jgi:hypothetical protein
MTGNVAAGLADWSRLMARLSAQFTAPMIEWWIDPSHRPASADRRDGRLIGALVLAIGVIWLGVAARELAAAGVHLAGWRTAGGYVCLGIGAALALWGCRILFRRQTVRIDHDGVHVRFKQLFWITSWSEPLTRYRGVVWRSVPIERQGTRRTVHLLDLWHEEPDKTVTLFSSTDGHAAHEFWRAWAHRLGLPPIRWRSIEPESVPYAEQAELARSH